MCPVSDYEDRIVFFCIYLSPISDTPYFICIFDLRFVITHKVNGPMHTETKLVYNNEIVGDSTSPCRYGEKN